MADFIDEDLTGSTFERVSLSGARFSRVSLRGAEVRAGEVVDTSLRGVSLSGVVMRGVELVDVDIYGEIGGLTVNGVDVGPLIEAELDRRYPDRAKMRPSDAAGFREAWSVLERLWARTEQRARGMDSALLHVSVDGEWSFIETLRHLVFATDSWIKRAVIGEPSPWHPLALPWDEMPDMPGVIPRDREARPSLNEVLALRHDRMATVRDVLEGLTDERLDADTEPVTAPGWPEPRAYPVRECLSIVLNEEWEHRLYAERDLDALEARKS
ncbi:DinB family protein [Glycomyces halotolerans]